MIGFTLVLVRSILTIRRLGFIFRFFRFFRLESILEGVLYLQYKPPMIRNVVCQCFEEGRYDVSMMLTCDASVVVGYDKRRSRLCKAPINKKYDN